jgi:anti-sigma B factor antagonist
MSGVDSSITLVRLEPGLLGRGIQLRRLLADGREIDPPGPLPSLSAAPAQTLMTHTADPVRDIQQAGRAFLESELEGGQRLVLVDLEGVEWLSSTGLGVLVSWYSVVNGFQGQLVLARLTPRVAELLVRTHIDRVLKWAPSLEAAQELLHQLERESRN